MLGKGIVSKKNRLWLYLTIIAGSFAQVIMIFPSGLRSQRGIQFWGAQFHDGLWHIAIVKKFVNFSFENPVFAGEKLGNYHYFSDLLVALVHIITRIDVFVIYYKILPSVISLSTGFFVFLLSKKLFKSEVAAIWSMFFVFLGSNFAYLLPFFGLGYPIWETNFWVQQPMSIYSNMPYALSVPIVLSSIYFLTKYLSGPRNNYLILSALLLAIAPATKSFTFFIFPGLFVISLYRVYKNKKFDLLIYFSCTLLIAILLMLPSLRFSDNFIYEPGWFLKTMIEAPDRMNWQDWSLRYQFYKSNNDIFNLVRFYITAFVIFFVGNLGTRVLAFVGVYKIRKLPHPEIHFLLLFSSFLLAIFPMFYLSSGIAWNTIQFYYYFLLFLGIYAGYGTYILLNNTRTKLYKIGLAIIIILFSIPVDIQTFYFYYSRPTGSYVTYEELEAFNYLNINGDDSDRVLTFPIGASFIHLAAYTGKTVFLGDEITAVLTGHDYRKRLDEINSAIEEREGFLKYLRKNKIRWIYDVTSEKSEILKNGNIKTSFKKGNISIYEVVF